VKKTLQEPGDLLFDGVGEAGRYLDHIDLERFDAGAHFVLCPQGNELAAWDGGVGTHGGPGVGK
jgi:hypothetical protein